MKKTIVIKCDYCGALIPNPQFRKGAIFQRFCCNKCRSAWHNKNRLRNILQQIALLVQKVSQ